jgi:hypothetical protein
MGLEESERSRESGRVGPSGPSGYPRILDREIRIAEELFPCRGKSCSKSGVGIYTYAIGVKMTESGERKEIKIPRCWKCARALRAETRLKIPRGA